MKFFSKIKEKFFGDANNKVAETVAVATVAMAPAVAFANDIPEPDVSKIVTYIGVTAVAAIVAIGGAKFIPAAAIWLYTSITGMIKRT